MARSAIECAPQAPGERGFQVRRAHLVEQRQMAMWCENQSERNRIHEELFSVAGGGSPSSDAR
jgi:hypothetical protein